ncbi:MAG: FKBP-type peptidyl-prolyl cis-trans isomerase [Spirochaetes bacterium]|nr:FKBP-type peptidyl-prolyl cis-trans isomerase [Spirochaetota bacterium]
MKKTAITAIIITLLFAGCSHGGVKLSDGIYAEFHTTQGKIICELYYEKVPVTIGNFVGLAEGTKEFTDPETQEKVKKPYYNNLTFHRIVKDFVIQGGCPLGNGTGGPGYSFIDEFNETLSHDAKGILSMANAGPNSNGSQFFITLAPVKNLDNRHTVFGKIIEGLDVVDAIGNIPTDENENPTEKQVIKKVKIIRVGKKAKQFDAEAAFNLQEEIKKQQEEKQKQQLTETLTKLGLNEDQLTTTRTGLQFKIIKEGTGNKPSKGDQISMHFKGYFANGELFDSTYETNETVSIAVGMGQILPGWDEALLDMKTGEKRIAVIPYYLAFGEKGYQSIPPKATLIFEIELVSIKSQQEIEREANMEIAKTLKNLGVNENQIVKTETGLQYFVKAAGSGQSPKAGATIVAHYKGLLPDGSEFDSSYQRNQPFETQIGVGRVIAGWDEAFLGMKKGEKRVLIIPYQLGYGEQGYPPVIPPKTTLIFEVELLDIK